VQASQQLFVVDSNTFSRNNDKNDLETFCHEFCIYPLCSSGVFCKCNYNNGHLSLNPDCNFLYGYHSSKTPSHSHPCFFCVLNAHPSLHLMMMYSSMPHYHPLQQPHPSLSRILILFQLSSHNNYYTLINCNFIRNIYVPVPDRYI